MKKYYFLIAILLISMFFIFNDKIVKQEKSEYISSEEIEKFALDHNINILSSENTENYSLLSYYTSSKYGVMSLFIDGNTGQIAYIDNSIDLPSNSDQLIFLNFSLENEEDNFICIYILDEELIESGRDITVEFKEDTSDDSPHKITISTNENPTLLISYLTRGTLKEIERIMIRDENGNVIWDRSY